MNTNLTFNLANSIWYLEHKKRDVLTEVDWINTNLNAESTDAVVDISDDFVASIKHLRAIVLDVFNGETVDNEVDFLNELLKKRKTFNQIAIKNGETVMTSVSQSSVLDGILAKVASDLIDIIINSSVGRIHRCENDDCRFYYLDMSKNQSKKYCSLKCNNVAKVRRYRAKQ